MFLNFRQGIVSGTGFISNSSQGLGISGSPTQLTTITAAAGTQDILITLDRNFPGAFGISATPPQRSWVYVELQRSGTLDFGFTVVEPIVATTEPSAPVNNTHWFDTTANKMRVYRSDVDRFEEKIRVFLAIVETTGVINYYSPGVSQVSISAPSLIYQSGKIVFDEYGQAILKSDGSFLTTVSDILTSYGTNVAGNLEATIVSAVADGNISDNKVVRFSGYSNGLPKVQVAEYDDVDSSLIGYVTAGGLSGSVLRVTLQGLITNLGWTWEDDQIDIGAKLFVGPDNEAGDIIAYDPHDLNPARPKQVAIAKVVSNNSVYFAQGQGGIGKTGKIGPPGDTTTPATVDHIGGVRLSKASATPSIPVAVETTDPRLFDARPPLAHTHVGNEVTIEQFDIFGPTLVQDWIETLYSEKIGPTGGTINGGPLVLDFGTPAGNQAANADFVTSKIQELAVLKTGGAMTGILTLSDPPSQDFHAATKKYVDDTVTAANVGSTVHFIVEEINATVDPTSTFAFTIALGDYSIVTPVNILMYRGSIATNHNDPFWLRIRDASDNALLYEYLIQSSTYEEYLPITLPTKGDLLVEIVNDETTGFDIAGRLSFMSLDTYSGEITPPPSPLYLLRNDAGISSGYQLATITNNDFSYITPSTPPATNRIGIDIGFSSNLPMWTDKRAIEFQITRFDTGNLTYTGILDPGFYPNAHLSMFVGDSEWTFFGDDVATVSSPVAGNGLQTVGIVVDGTTGDAEFYLDGTLVGTQTTTLHTSTDVMFTLYWDGSAAVAGEGIEGTVRTLGTEYQYTYGTGVKDLQGNAL